MGQFNTDRIDVLKGSTDTPKKATQNDWDLRTSYPLGLRVCQSLWDTIHSS
jgi:hypothetical protein